MKILLFLLLLSGTLHSRLHANEPPRELPAGTSFAVKEDFWAYEIIRILPRQGGARYRMDTSTQGGIGSGIYKYISTFPAGTRFEVVDLIKKSRRRWFYVVKTVGEYRDPKIGEALIVIGVGAMLEEPLGRPTPTERHPTKTTRLDPDLFTDFHYPESQP